MAGDGSLATTAIITGGLTCGHAPLDPCKSGIITSAFSLYCTVTAPPKQPSGGGGPYPRDAWNRLNPGEIQNFYQPVPVEYYVVPRDKEEEYLRRYKPLKITFKMGDYSVEREYAVPEKKRNVVVKAFNMADVTRQRMNFAVSNVKKIAAEIKIVVRNFRLRNK